MFLANAVDIVPRQCSRMDFPCKFCVYCNFAVDCSTEFGFDGSEQLENGPTHGPLRPGPSFSEA